MVSDAELRTRGVYEAKVPLEVLLGDASRLSQILDKLFARRKQFRWISGVVVLVGVVCIVASSFLASGLLNFCGYLAAILGVILFIYSFFYQSGLIDGRDRVVVMKGISEKLRLDAATGSPFTVRLAVKKQPKLIRKEQWSKRTKGQQQFLENDFLSVEGKLLDGTVLTETVKELTRVRSYMNSRNKTKTKTRHRYLATLRFTYPQDVYGDARPACEALHEQIRLPGCATLRGTRVTEKAIVIKAMVDNKNDLAQTTAMLSLGAYRILNLARRVAAGTP